MIDIEYLSQLQTRCVTSIRKMESNNKSLKKETGLYLLCTDYEKRKIKDACISALMQDNYELIKMIEDTTHTISNYNGSDIDTPALVYQIGKAINIEYVEAMREFLQICTTFYEKKQKLAEQQYILLHPTASVDELSKAKSQDISQMLADSLMNGKHALWYIKHKHNEILKIEQGLRDIQILMFSMAALVDAQSQFVDEISENVEYSKQQIKTGKKHI